MIAIVEPEIPNAVLIRASEIPFARARASGAPAVARAAIVKCLQWILFRGCIHV